MSAGQKRSNTRVVRYHRWSYCLSKVGLYWEIRYCHPKITREQFWLEIFWECVLSLFKIAFLQEAWHHHILHELWPRGQSVSFCKSWAAVFLLIPCPVFCILMCKRNTMICPDGNNKKKVFKEELTLTATRNCGSDITVTKASWLGLCAHRGTLV